MASAAGEGDGHDRVLADYRQLFVQNRRWVAERLAAEPEFFERLAHGQSPRFLFIG